MSIMTHRSWKVRHAKNIYSIQFRLRLYSNHQDGTGKTPKGSAGYYRGVEGGKTLEAHGAEAHGTDEGAALQIAEESICERRSQRRSHVLLNKGE